MKIEIEITDEQYESIKLVAANRSKASGTEITAEDMVKNRCSEVVKNMAGRAIAVK